MTHDVRIINQGTLIGVLPLTAAGRDWIDDNVHSESWQWLGNTLYVEHRYADSLLDGMIAGGLTLTD